MQRDEVAPLTDVGQFDAPDVCCAGDLRMHALQQPQLGAGGLNSRPPLP